MNETIGAKGTGNDYRRSLKMKRLAKEKLKKEQEEQALKELEKQVRRKQTYTLIKTLPIVVGAGTIKTLVEVGKEKKDIKEERKFVINDKRYIKQNNIPKNGQVIKQPVVVNVAGEEVVIYVPVVVKQTEEKTEVQLVLPEKELEEYEIVEEKVDIQPEVIKEQPVIKPKGIEEQPIPEPEKDILDKLDESRAIEVFNIDREDFPELPKENQELLNKLKSKTLIDYYADQLKDIRYDLRNIIYDYNVLVDEEKDAHKSRDIEKIIDRLSLVISKIDELKDKIEIENLSLFDENYIFFLIQESLSFFSEDMMEEVKDTSLYNMIAKKIDELDKKKDEFQKELDDKKDKLEEREEDFEELKERFYSIDKINNDLLRFQYEQAQLLEEIRIKINESTTVKERVETEVTEMNKQNRRLMRLLTLQMILPGPKNAKKMALSAASYLYFMNYVMNANTKTKKYKIVQVKDYRDSILDSIAKIDDASSLLYKTSIQIDKMILEIKDKYSDYMDTVPECKELLSNLKKIKMEIEEKEYEMKKLKEAQELEYERNNQKLKTKGEYPVN